MTNGNHLRYLIKVSIVIYRNTVDYRLSTQIEPDQKVRT